MPDLTPPADVFDVAEIVAREFAGHEQHVDQRVRARIAAELLARAAALRSMPSVEDPLPDALKASCHMQGGLVYAHPSHVAATAYEAVAALLETPSNEEEENRGHVQDD